MPNWFSGVRAAYARRSRVGRELLIALAALVFGAVVMPFLIWGAGHLALGPYAHGGPLALLVDYFGGLAKGSFGFWVAALGPYLILTLGRLALAGGAREGRPVGN